MKKRIISFVFALIMLLSSSQIYAGEAESGAKETQENIVITVFWPPSASLITDKQYRYLAEAGITEVLGAGNGADGVTSQLRMLELCEKYGMKLIVSNPEISSAFNTPKATLAQKKYEANRESFDKFKNHPAKIGYYMIDEPHVPNEYINMYLNLKNFDPDGVMHLNFLPMYAYPDKSSNAYEKAMTDWARLSEANGYKQSYLMFDMYPYNEGSGMSLQAFLDNTEVVRRVGLREGVDTAMYLQSIGIKGALRSPTESEMRYEANLALAFGYKKLSYFTWITPPAGVEKFFDGIMTGDGKKNEKYDEVARINKELLAIGKTLVHLDAFEVYQSKQAVGLVGKLPADFFAQPQKGADLTVSYLRHRENGRNYLMLVNNSYVNKRKIKVTFDEEIKSVSLISNQTGEREAVVLDENNAAKLEFEAGGAVLLELDESYDYEAGKPEAEKVPTRNLAAEGRVLCTSSTGEKMRYMMNLNDGQKGRTSPTWRTVTSVRQAAVTIELDGVQSFNRIDIYPSGSKSDYGKNMPRDFDVYISSDGEVWEKLAEARDIKALGYSVPSLRFEEQRAKYIKIDITRFNGNYAELSEIEVYCDDGTVAEPKQIAKSDEDGEYSVKYLSAGTSADLDPETETDAVAAATEATSATAAETEGLGSDIGESERTENSDSTLPIVICTAALIAAIAVAVVVLLKKRNG